MKKSTITVCFFAMSMIFGCSGGSGSSDGGTPSSGKTITGNAVKGTISGGTINFYSMKNDGTKNTLLGSSTTDANGNFKVSFTTTPTYPILAEATGGSYIDEVSGTTVPLIASDTLTALLCTETSQTTITPLTHMAATRARALAAAGTSLTTACTSSNIGTAQQFMIGDIIKTLAVSANNTIQVSTATREQRAYGIVMAGIVQEAQTLGVRAFDLVNALATDMADGVMDGKNGANSITIPKISSGSIPLTASMGTTDLQAAIDKFMLSTNNKTNLSTKPISLQPVQVGMNGAGLFYTTSTVLPAWISGQNGSATLTATGGTPPYRCSVKQGSTMPTGFSISSDCIISGSSTLPSGTPMRITPPFTVTMSDSAVPPASKDMGLNITIVQPSPKIAPVNGTCEQNKPCNITIATASGGTQPYYFTSDSFATGAPPMGTVVGTGFSLVNGILTGTPTTTGTYPFGICVVDQVGAEDCGRTSVTVNPATPTGTGSTGTWKGNFTVTDVSTTYNADPCTYTTKGIITLNLNQDGTSVIGTNTISSLQDTIDSSKSSLICPPVPHCSAASGGIKATINANGNLIFSFFSLDCGDYGTFTGTVLDTTMSGVTTKTYQVGPISDSYTLNFNVNRQ